MDVPLFFSGTIFQIVTHQGKPKCRPGGNEFIVEVIAWVMDKTSILSPRTAMADENLAARYQLQHACKVFTKTYSNERFNASEKCST